MQRTVIFFIMANTYAQWYFHLVFAIKNRDALIKKSWENELEMHATGINIAVRCTFTSLQSAFCYKYLAALPLPSGMKGIEETDRRF